MKIGLLTASQLSEAASVYALSWQTSHRSILSPDALSRHDATWARSHLEGLTAAGHLLLGLYEEGTLRGVIAVRPRSGELSSLYVHPAHWGKGYGSALLRAALLRIPSGITPSLTVLSSNARARALYERRGFLPSGKAVLLNPEKNLSELTYIHPERKQIMKVLAINGSPHAHGNTAAAIGIVAGALREEGIETEIVQVGHLPVRSCIDCRACRSRPDHHCAFDDVVNACIDKAQSCDGFLFGSPTYYAGMSGAMKAFMDRLFFTGGLPPYKVGMAICAVRRTGGLDVYHQLNNFMDITNFIRVPLPYWSVAYGNRDGDMMADEEAVSVLRTGGKQMAWLMKSLACAKDAVPMPALPERKWTNFIR